MLVSLTILKRAVNKKGLEVNLLNYGKYFRNLKRNVKEKAEQPTRLILAGLVYWPLVAGKRRLVGAQVVMKGRYYLPNPSARAEYDTRSIFKRSLTGLNSEFSFS